MPALSVFLCAVLGLCYRWRMDQPPFEAPRREPVFNVPGIVLLLIGAFVAVHFWRMTLDDHADLNFLIETALVPARLTVAFGIEQVDGLLEAISRDVPVADRERATAIVQVFVGEGESRPWTLITYSFLHGDFSHLAINSVWLLAFGSAIARRFATLRFLLFFAACGIAGAVAQWLSDTSSAQPVIGASGAIAGMMGASMRFMFRDEIRLGPGAERYAFIPRLSLSETFANHRVLTFVAMMLGINILIGLGFQFLSAGDMRIAWQAHIGGFLFGILAFAWFDPVPAEGAS